VQQRYGSGRHVHFPRDLPERSVIKKRRGHVLVTVVT